MNQIDTTQFLETVLSFLESTGKSRDISSVLIELKVPAPSTLNDLVTELSLAADPTEEEGVGCLTLAELREMIEQYKISELITPNNRR